MVTLCPLHSVVPPDNEMFAFGKGFTVMITFADAVQLYEFVTVTVYVLVAVGATEKVAVAGPPELH